MASKLLVLNINAKLPDISKTDFVDYEPNSNDDRKHSF